MLFMYFFLLSIVLINVNFYVVWFMMEVMFLFFILYIITWEMKSVGLIIYYFFQSFLSLLLFMVVFLMLTKLIFMILCAKLGLFPFFYWVILVSMKVGVYGNMFILALQKISVFWLFWVLSENYVLMLFLCVYCGMIFVTISLSLVSDLWLLLVYSSIANTGLLLLSSLGSMYMYNIILYLVVILCIIFMINYSSSYVEMLLIVLLFLVVPPFILFFVKLFLILSLESLLKLGFYVFVFDVFILFYYFTFIFMKFMLFDSNMLIYFMNYLVLLSILFFSNYVALVVFY